MVICEYFLKGICRYGNNCRNEHRYPNSNNSSFGNNNNKYGLMQSVNILKADLKTERPKWPFSSYITTKGGVVLIENSDVSPEELRYKYMIAQNTGQMQQFNMYVQELTQKINNAIQNILANPEQALQGKLQQSNNSTFGQQNAFNSNKSAFGNTSTSAFGSTGFGNNTTSAFGNTSTSAFGSTGFGNNKTSAFGNTSTPAFGSTGFGNNKTSAFGNTSTPAFGSTGFGNNKTSAFGNTSTPAFGSTGFGNNKTSAFGNTSTPAFGSTGFGNNTTSAFGSNNTTTAFGSNNTTSAFGSNNTASAFGNNNNTAGGFNFINNKNNETSAFGNNKTTSVFGNTTFGNINSTFGNSFGNNNANSVYYGDEKQLSSEQIQNFEAPEFTFKAIPEIPPPQKYC